MWYHNLLLPCLVLRIFYSLIRRKIFPYPTLAELREHRSEISRANEFGDQISARLSASSFGVKEMWRLFKVFNKTTKNKVKHSAKEKVKEKGHAHSRSLGDLQKEDVVSEPEDATVLDDTHDTQEVRDMKRSGLHVLNELADLHERIKKCVVPMKFIVITKLMETCSIFIWRHPSSSRTYGTVRIFKLGISLRLTRKSQIIFFLFLVTLFLPAKYLAKLTYFVGGVFFWHITPVIAALPSAERARYVLI